MTKRERRTWKTLILSWEIKPNIFIIIIINIFQKAAECLLCQAPGGHQHSQWGGGLCAHYNVHLWTREGNIV